MVMMVVDGNSLQSDSQVAWSEGQWPLGAVLHFTNEPSELSQRPCGHDDPVYYYNCINTSAPKWLETINEKMIHKTVTPTASPCCGCGLRDFYRQTFTFPAQSTIWNHLPQILIKYNTDKTNQLLLDSLDQKDLAVEPKQARHVRGRREICHEVGSASRNTLRQTRSRQFLHCRQGFETDDWLTDKCGNAQLCRELYDSVQQTTIY